MPSYQLRPVLLLTVVAILITQPLSAGPETRPSSKHAAQRVLREAKTHASRIKDMVGRSIILKEIALQQAEIGDVEGALQTANAIDERTRDKTEPSIDIDDIDWLAEMKFAALEPIVKELAKSWDNDALLQLATTGVIKEADLDEIYVV